MSLRGGVPVGGLVTAVPVPFAGNPELDEPPFVGVFLGRHVDPTGRLPGMVVVLEGARRRVLWSHRWDVEGVS